MKKIYGLDVHKDNIFCTIYNGESYSQVKEYIKYLPIEKYAFHRRKGCTDKKNDFFL